MSPLIRPPCFLLVIASFLVASCCPPPCSYWIASGPTLAEPADYSEPDTPAETDEFIYYKGKGSHLHNFSLARQAAIEDVYKQISDSIIRHSRQAPPERLRSLAVSGVVIIEEHNVKSTTLYRHKRKRDLTSIAVKYEVIVIARYPKYDFMRALERVHSEY
ncbi:MAG: hypothetical protein KDC66_19200 [Phaeodactylibacter sp.]|nr:hypothetical protein [Phaeodactylibacter sp.]MCB9272669.1 hypothetical protein [Lewinellaceae bacterium]